MADRGTPVAVGLVVGGDWARLVHAPMFAAGPQTRLAGAWSRTPAKAAAVADTYGCRAFASFEELIEASELVSFAVPPAAQPMLARRAALAGRHVLLEKPVADRVEEAVSLADTLACCRVGSLLMLTYSFSPQVRSFVAGCRVHVPHSVVLRFLTTTRPDELTGWRRRCGLLLDLGYHVFDLLDAVLGTICRVAARGDRGRRVDLRVEHAAGGSSTATVAWAGLPVRRTELEVLTSDGPLVLDPRACVRGDWLPRSVRAAVWSLVRERRRLEPGIARGVYLQRCVAAAESSLDERSPVEV